MKQQLDILESLVNQCKSGSRKAQVELYDRYAQAMFTTCCRMIKDNMWAEEVMQDAFITAFKKIDSFKGESTFGAWLKRIVINKCIDELNKKKIEFTDVESLPEPKQEDVNELNTEWEIKRIKRVMGTLPDGYRIILSLYLFEGYDHEEISSILGITSSTSRSQFLRAKKKLVSVLKTENYA